MVVRHTCKNEEDPIKNEDKITDAQGQPTPVSGGILPNFKLIQAFIGGLVICKNEEDPIKNEGARVLTRLYDVFSDAQGQLTPKSAAEFCRNLNSSKLL